MTAIGIHSHPVKKLGRRSPSRKPAIEFATHLGVPPTAPIVDVAPNLAWPMDKNNEWGDCVVPGARDHALQAIYSAFGLPYTNMTDVQILADYRTQNPSFDPNSSAHGPGSDSDGGMDIQTYLGYLVKIGIILGFAKVNHANSAEMHQAIWLGLVVVTGENLTVAQQTQRVWDIVPGDSAWGGHCTCSVGYPDASHETCVTWGSEVGMTGAFVRGTSNAGVEEAWFIITQAHVDHPSFRAGYDLASFGAEYTALTGRPFTWTPSPAPAPAPAPAPTPVPTVDADKQLASIARPWVLAGHSGQNHVMANALKTWLASKAL